MQFHPQLFRALSWHGVATGAIAGAITVGAAAQTPPPTDCDENGIEDFEQWGPYYAYWNGNGAGNDGGSLNSWSLWCPAEPGGLDPLDRLVFGQLPGQPIDLCTMAASLSAWSLRLEEGAFEIQSPSAGLTLNSSKTSPSSFDVNGMLVVNANIQQVGPYSSMSIGNAGSTGIVEVRGKDLSTDGSIMIGATGTGELAITGGSVTCQALYVGGTTPGSTIGGRLTVGTAGTLGVQNSLQVHDVATVDGSVEIVGTWGGVFGVYNEMAERPVLAGSGKVAGAVNAAELTLFPRLGTGADGLTDAVFTISGPLAMSYAETNLKGVLRIAARVFPAMGPVVPMVEASSATLGGTLRLYIDPAALGDLPSYNPIVRCAPGALSGDFAAIEVAGLPNNRTVRLVRPPTMDEVGFTIVTALASPSVASGPTNSLARVVTDAVLGDFNGDGTKDVAMAMAVDASGTSEVRFFNIGTENALTLKATVTLEGDARGLATIPDEGPCRLVVALGTANKAAVLTSTGGWIFATETLEVGPDTTPSSIAVGRFVDATNPFAREIAVGCLGTNQVRVFGTSTSGTYALIATVDGVRADVLRSGTFDEFPGHDLLALAESTRMATIVTKIFSSAATVTAMTLPAVPSDAAIVSLDGATGRQNGVISLSGAGSDPEIPVDTGMILRLAPGDIVDIVASLNLGDNPLSVTSADFDEDGDGDIAAATTVAGVQQVRLLFNNTDPAAPELLTFQDGGAMSGAIHRPRIVVACDAHNGTAPRLLSVNAGIGSGGFLGPEMDGGIGTFGGGDGGVPGDVNGDGVVDGTDMTALFSAWGTTDAAADLNGDGIVDALDLASVLSGWTAP